MEKLQAYKKFIEKCTKSTKSVGNYTDFKKINKWILDVEPTIVDGILSIETAEKANEILSKLLSLPALSGEKPGVLFDRAGNGQYIAAFKTYIMFLSARDLFSDYLSETSSRESVNDSFSSLPTKPLQQIFYGAPGTGKSHATNDVVENLEGTIRTTFHPDSDYSTFVGAYKPVEVEEVQTQTVWDFASKSAISIPVLNPDGTPSAKKKSITYNFVKQAFTKAYLLAWKKYMSGAGSSSYVKSKLAERTTHATGTSTGITSPFDETSVQLTQNEKDALIKIDGFGYDFDGYSCFGDIHKEIKVIIADKPSADQAAEFQSRITKEEYKEIEKKLEEVKKKLETAEGKTRENLMGLEEALRGILQRYHQDNTGDYVAEMDGGLLGLYSPTEEAVYLFMGNIRYPGNVVNIKLLCAVYVHELLHAYFDSGDHYVKEIEEPIVECLTLCFLKEYDAANSTSLCKGYLSDVDRKKYTPFGYYAFGAYLYNNSDVDWLTEYKNKNGIIIPGDPLLNDYIDSVKLYYPFENELGAYKALYYIFVDTVKKQEHCGGKPQFLVIEEINRGNCAQIFGDIFQLLDRQDNGFSTYPIEADADLQKAIQKAFAEEPEFKLSADLSVDNVLPKYKSAHGGTLSSDIQNGHVLLLPNNLYIWATMNTSDQSLFPIDSAFKRRWDWKYVPIDTEKENWKLEVNGKAYSWSSFLKKINEDIYDLTKSEDKMLGFYFCKAEEKKITAERFVSKVLFYIYNDVYKDYGLDREFFKDKEDASRAITFQSLYNATTGKLNEARVEKLITNLNVEDYVEDIAQVDGEDVDADDSSTKKHLRVSYLNDAGEVVETVEKMKSSETFVEVISRIDPEEIVKLNLKIGDFELMTKGRHENKAGGYAGSQREVSNGYFVVTKMDNPMKKKRLETISDALGLNLKVELVNY